MLQTASELENSTPATRVVGTPWVRGAPSPNPTGRPKKTPDERVAEALAKRKAPMAMRKLVAMIESPQTTESGRLRAIELLLDRGLGKARARAEEPREGMHFVVQQLVIEPPPGGFPGVLCHPDPRWIDRSRVTNNSTSIVIDANGTGQSR